MTVERAKQVLNPNDFEIYNDEVQNEALAIAVRSIEAWQKVMEELKEEMTGLDMFVEKEHTIRWCLHVIDNALGEVGEQDG